MSFKSLLNFFLPLNHVYNRLRHRKDDEGSNSLWVTLFSLLIHGGIVALLWSAPAIEINPPEIPPPQSIDATILPPPPPEEAPKTASAPPLPSMPPAANTPAPTPTSASTPTAAKEGAPADNNGAAGTVGENGSSKKPDEKPTTPAPAAKPALKSGSPTPITIPDGGFRVEYDLSGTMDGNVSANGKAILQFERKGGQYTAVLSATAKELWLKATLMGQASGEVRANTIATTSFVETSDIPFSDTEQSKFEVDYANGKANFTSKGKSNQTDLTTDAVYDYVSAISYLQMAFQQGRLRAGQGNIPLPVGKRNEIDMANISIGQYEGASSKVNTNNNSAIPATITLNSKNLKYIKVWFVAEKNYMPLKIEIATKKIQLTLLARKIG